MNIGSNWALWRSFAAVAQHGSLSRAGRALGLSQPTVGRHIEALETGLRAKLFERSVSGLAPTELGLRAYEKVQRAALALAEAELVAAGAVGHLDGSVRITASAVFSHLVLPAMLGELRREFPRIAFELVPTDSPENLLLREADIAVRMFRPTQSDLVARKLGETAVVACAHEDYLARHGVPATLDDLRAHDLIGFDRSDMLIVAAAELGITLHRDDFAIRCDSQSAMWELIRAGVGIGFAQEIIIRETPGMRVLPLPLSIPPMEVWLTSHQQLHTARRIRAVYDRLGEMISFWLGRTGVQRQNGA